MIRNDAIMFAKRGDTYIKSTRISSSLLQKNKRLLKVRYDKNVRVEITENQGGLNKKEIQLNLCNIFSIFIFNELYLFA